MGQYIKNIILRYFGNIDNITIESYYLTEYRTGCCILSYRSIVYFCKF